MAINRRSKLRIEQQRLQKQIEEWAGREHVLDPRRGEQIVVTITITKTPHLEAGVKEKSRTELRSIERAITEKEWEKILSHSYPWTSDDRRTIQFLRNNNNRVVGNELAEVYQFDLEDLRRINYYMKKWGLDFRLRLSPDQPRAYGLSWLAKFYSIVAVE